MPKQLKTVNYFDEKKKLTVQANAVVASAGINSFSPTQIAGGAGSELTISGSAFGTTTGKVFFKNADDAGATEVEAPSSQITSWTDTEIKVKVPGGPDGAGTGAVRIESSTGTSYTSTGTLTITHSYTNAYTGVRALHIGNISGYGDFDNLHYVFKYHTDFKNNTAAVTSFEDGFNEIVCDAGINFKISTSTTTAGSPAADNINSISFDSTIPNGVLGQALIRTLTANGVTIIMRLIYVLLLLFQAPIHGILIWTATPQVQNLILMPSRAMNSGTLLD